VPQNFENFTKNFQKFGGLCPNFQNMQFLLKIFKNFAYARFQNLSKKFSEVWGLCHNFQNVAKNVDNFPKKFS
jgi:hypothetical protein